VVRRHQLAWDEKSEQKIAQMLALDLPTEIAAAVSANRAHSSLAETGCAGITYPSGGWLCPQQLTAELLGAGGDTVSTRYNVKVTADC
jgi:tRNA 5-methylaminomethyl-2-thiouridine biosynthesis bifunctional protein